MANLKKDLELEKSFSSSDCELEKFETRLGSLLESHGSIARIARKGGFSEAVVRKWRNGLSEPDVSNLVKLADACGVTVQWLATGRGLKQLGMVNDVQGEYGNAVGSGVPFFKHWSDMLSWVSNNALQDNVTRLQAAPLLGLRVFALPVRGLFMAPLFPPGARIIVDPDQPAETDAYVVYSVDGWDQATFRRMVKDANRIFLEPINPKYETLEITNEAHTYFGRVVRMEIDF